jgi:type IV secretion system protein VirD4
MNKWQKIPLGVVCLLAGGACVLWFGAAIFDGLAITKTGFTMPNLAGFIAGLFGIGAAGDCLLPPRKRAADNKESVAKSQWATHEDVAPFLGDSGKEGIYVGMFEGQSLRQRNALHTLVIGPPGSNKSVGIAIPCIASLLRSLLIMDIKGELCAVTYHARAKMGRVIVLNPFGELREGRPWMQSHGFSPLLYLDAESSDFAATARTIADCIVTKSTGSGEYFSTASVNLLALFLMWEVYICGNRLPNLAAVRDAITAPTLYDEETKKPVSGLLYTLQLMSECRLDAIRAGGARLLTRLSDKNTQNAGVNDVIETLLKDLAPLLDDPRMVDDMADGYIDFAAMHREIITVYVVVPLRELTNQAKWLRIFVSLALRGLYANPPASGAPLPPVTFLLDEFGQLGTVGEISKALTAARGYSIQLIMILQSLSQLEKHYKDDWNDFFTGSGAVVLFRPKDLKTAEHLSKIYGNREEKVQTETNNGGSITPTATPLIRAEDLMRIQRGQTVTIIENCKWPILASAPLYVDTPFGEGLDPNPFYRG